MEKKKDLHHSRKASEMNLVQRTAMNAFIVAVRSGQDTSTDWENLVHLMKGNSLALFEGALEMTLQAKCKERPLVEKLKASAASEDYDGSYSKDVDVDQDRMTSRTVSEAFEVLDHCEIRAYAERVLCVANEKEATRGDTKTTSTFFVEHPHSSSAHTTSTLPKSDVDGGIKMEETRHMMPLKKEENEEEDLLGADILHREDEVERKRQERAEPVILSAGEIYRVNGATNEETIPNDEENGQPVNNFEAEESKGDMIKVISPPGMPNIIGKLPLKEEETEEQDPLPTIAATPDASVTSVEATFAAASVAGAVNTAPNDSSVAPLTGNKALVGARDTVSKTPEVYSAAEARENVAKTQWGGAATIPTTTSPTRAEAADESDDVTKRTPECDDQTGTLAAAAPDAASASPVLINPDPPEPSCPAFVSSISMESPLVKTLNTSYGMSRDAGDEFESLTFEAVLAKATCALISAGSLKAAVAKGEVAHFDETPNLHGHAYAWGKSVPIVSRMSRLLSRHFSSHDATILQQKQGKPQASFSRSADGIVSVIGAINEESIPCEDNRIENSSFDKQVSGKGEKIKVIEPSGKLSVILELPLKEELKYVKDQLPAITGSPASSAAFVAAAVADTFVASAVNTALNDSSGAPSSGTKALIDANDDVTKTPKFDSAAYIAAPQSGAVVAEPTDAVTKIHEGDDAIIQATTPPTRMDAAYKSDDASKWTPERDAAAVPQAVSSASPTPDTASASASPADPAQTSEVDAVNATDAAPIASDFNKSAQTGKDVVGAVVETNDAADSAVKTPTDEDAAKPQKEYEDSAFLRPSLLEREKGGGPLVPPPPLQGGNEVERILHECAEPFACSADEIFRVNGATNKNSTTTNEENESGINLESELSTGEKIEVISPPGTLNIIGKLPLKEEETEKQDPLPTIAATPDASVAYVTAPDAAASDDGAVNTALNDSSVAPLTGTKALVDASDAVSVTPEVDFLSEATFDVAKTQGGDAATILGASPQIGVDVADISDDASKRTTEYIQTETLAAATPDAVCSCPFLINPYPPESSHPAFVSFICMESPLVKTLKMTHDMSSDVGDEFSPKYDAVLDNTTLTSAISKEDEAHFDVAQNLYGATKDAWAWGKTVPIVSNVLDLTEAVALKALDITVHSDFVNIDEGLKMQLKKLDDTAVTPAISVVWKVIEPAVGKADEIVFKSFGSEAKKEGAKR